MYSNSDFRIGISNVDYRKVKTNDDRIEFAGRHGVSTSPTYIRGRQIVIEGFVIATTRAKVSMGMDWLDNLFSLQGNPGNLEMGEFVVTDEQDRQWKTNAKVDTSIDYSIEDDNDHNNGSWRGFRVSLFAPDHRFLSGTSTVVTGDEGEVGGFNIDFQMDEDFQFITAFNEITVQGGVSAVPLKITITVNAGKTVDGPITIYNVNTGTWFRFNANGTAGDIFVVDSDSLTLTKNSINIMATRQVGSIRPYAVGETKFAIQDNDGTTNPHDFSVSIAFNNTMI